MGSNTRSANACSLRLERSSDHSQRFPSQPHTSPLWALTPIMTLSPTGDLETPHRANGGFRNERFFVRSKWWLDHSKIVVWHPSQSVVFGWSTRMLIFIKETP